MISIMMQGTNQKCNTLKSVFGIFLHSCNTPQKVIDALAHMGISISVDTSFHHTDLPEAWSVAKDLLCSSPYFCKGR